MDMPSVAKRFLRSRSGRAFLLYLGLCAALSAMVGSAFYYVSLNWFVEHKSEEKVTALRLVDAFVTTYSSLRSQLGGAAPVDPLHQLTRAKRFRAQPRGHESLEFGAR